MKPWEKLGTAPLPEGKELALYHRDGEYSVRVDGAILMTSRTHHSEEQLGSMAVAHLGKTNAARVLVGGLGMGFTLRAVLDVVPPDARVDMVELVPEVVIWNQGPLGKLAHAPLLDTRVKVLVADVVDVIGATTQTYDAIVLDVDNGPAAMTSSRNERLYSAEGLARTLRALSARGVLTIWSSSDSPEFTARLRDAGFCGRAARVRARGHGSATHVVWRATPA